MLNEIGTTYFPEVSVESLLTDPYTKKRIAESWEKVKDMPWVSV